MKIFLSAIALTVVTATGILQKSIPGLPPATNDVSLNRLTAHDSSLKDHFKTDFLIGTALNVPEIEEKVPQASNLITCPIQFHNTGKHHEM